MERKSKKVRIITIRTTKNKKNLPKFENGKIKPWINWGIGETVIKNCLGDGKK